MNELQIFNNEEFGQVRTVVIDNEPYFVGKDVAEALGYAKPTDAVRKRVDEEDRGISKMETPSGTQDMTVINESGMYSLILCSKLPSSKKFKHWVTSEVLPSIRKTGVYEAPKTKERSERLASVNNAVKILIPMLKEAGCGNKIQLLTAKSLYEKAGVELPLVIEAEKQYFDTVHIARQVKIYTKSNKPASKAIGEIIRRLDITEDEYTETWEAKGSWQGTVRKYSVSVIDKIRDWIIEKDYPEDIEYKESNGKVKYYHVCYEKSEVA